MCGSWLNLPPPAEWKRTDHRSPAARDNNTGHRALEIWRETVPLPGTPGEVHLASRGVQSDSEALRWHPNCPFGHGVRVGCMVGLVRNIVTNESQAIHRTAISPTGEKLSHLGNNGRLSLGPTGGGAIKLTEDATSTGHRDRRGHRDHAVDPAACPTSSRCRCGAS